MRIETARWSIALPIGWTVITTEDWVRMILDRSEVNLRELPLDGAALGDYSHARIQRHIGDGRPDCSNGMVAGRPSWIYDWTDGVQFIRSTFVEIPTGCLLIDRVLPILDTSLRAELDAVISTVAWR